MSNRWHSLVNLRLLGCIEDLLRRRARHPPVTVAGVDTHGASILCQNRRANCVADLIVACHVHR
eukprot:SAG25_NODE_8298_length_429_cov_0.781818_1_plen_63_part_10